MNKQELIEKYEDKLKDIQLKFGANFKTKVYEGLVEDLRQLDEPKVTIPQFVADWIEEGKKHCKDVSDLFDFDFTNKEVGNWFLQEKPFDLVARAWLDGYEIEKEKRYLVKAKGVYLNSCLVFEKKNKKWFFSSIYEIDHQRGYHTRKELEEADFGWMFDCPGIEIEEVKG
jgi:hypothetical protein